jgi:hypothetical protein
MTQHQFEPHRVFEPIVESSYTDVLVTGCSFSFNYSRQHPASWPYYLRDLAGLARVRDTALCGSGCQHQFNSVINEIESDPSINPSNTIVIVMWSGMSRTDVIADSHTVEDWVREQRLSDLGDDKLDRHYRFDHRFSTLNIPNWTVNKSRSMIPDMRNLYKRVIHPEAQVLQSMINIVALAGYLDSQGYARMFLSWRDPELDLETVPGALADRVRALLDPVVPLGLYAERHQQMDHTMHPTIEAHLAWTREHLIPALRSKNLVQDTHAV